MLRVRLNAHDGMDTQRMTGIAQQVYGLKQIEEQHRFKNVELHLSCFCRLGDRYVISEYLKAHLIAYFWNNRIHLSRHNTASRLAGRQHDFRKSGFRPAGHQTQIVTHL